MARAAKSDKPADDGSAPKKVNGLTKPMVLSPALAAIVGAKKDEKLARDGSHRDNLGEIILILSAVESQ
jgi:hypothetical protein